MIRIKNVHVSRGGIKLLENFSWQIDAGQHWVIAGDNGSGKTLLMEVIAGAVHLQAGEIEYDFIKSTQWDERYAEKRKRIVYIPAHALHTFLKGSDTHYYQQRYYEIGDERTPTVKEILNIQGGSLEDLQIPSSLSITHLLNLEVTRLSNGQLKKLLLVKNFLKGIPKLLLMDYPFEGLDYQSREDLCLFIDFLCREHGVQTILTDHHHHLPAVINHKLVMEGCRIKSSEEFNPINTQGEVSAINKAHTTSDEELVAFHNLQIRYGAHHLFKNFNWTVRRGERWALIGRNGVGKTTLFSLIFADHPQAYAQQIFLFGKRRGSGESIWDIKRRISYLGPEQMSYLIAQNGGITATDYLSQDNLTQTGNLQALTEFFEVAEMMKKPIRVLSSGQLQLLMIIRCFLSDKELLLLDEPFQFLDNNQKERVTRYLLSHLKPDTTLILITHYEHDIRQWTEHRMQL